MLEKLLNNLINNKDALFSEGVIEEFIDDLDINEQEFIKKLLTKENYVSLSYLVNSFPEEMLYNEGGKANKATLILLILLSTFIGNSRDFIKGLDNTKDISKLYNIVLDDIEFDYLQSGTEVSITQFINNIENFDKYPESKLLYLLAYELGYKPGDNVVEFNDEIKELLINKVIIEQLPLLNRHKGTITGMDEFIKNVIMARNLTAGVDYEIEEEPNQIDIQIEMPEHTLNLGTMFYKVLMSIKPAGTKLVFPQIFKKLFETWNNLLMNTSELQLTPVEANPAPNKQRRPPEIEVTVSGDSLQVRVVSRNNQATRVKFDVYYNYLHNFDGDEEYAPLNFYFEVNEIIQPTPSIYGVSIKTLTSDSFQFQYFKNPEGLEAKVTIENIRLTDLNGNLASEPFDYDEDITLEGTSTPNLSRQGKRLITKEEFSNKVYGHTTDNFGVEFKILNLNGYPVSTDGTYVTTATNDIEQKPHAIEISPYSISTLYYYNMDEEDTYYTPNSNFTLALTGKYTEGVPGVTLATNGVTFKSPSKTKLLPIDIELKTSEYFYTLEIKLKNNNNVYLHDISWADNNGFSGEVMDELKGDNKWYKGPDLYLPLSRANVYHTIVVTGVFKGETGSGYTYEISSQAGERTRTFAIVEPTVYFTREETTLQFLVYNPEPYEVRARIVSSNNNVIGSGEFKKINPKSYEILSLPTTVNTSPYHKSFNLEMRSDYISKKYFSTYEITNINHEPLLMPTKPPVECEIEFNSQQKLLRLYFKNLNNYGVHAHTKVSGSISKGGLPIAVDIERISNQPIPASSWGYIDILEYELLANYEGSLDVEIRLKGTGHYNSISNDYASLHVDFILDSNGNIDHLDYFTEEEPIIDDDDKVYMVKFPYVSD